MDFIKFSSLDQSELAGLKLILSILSTYPISLIYQLFLINSNVNIKCIYFILTSLLLSYFNYATNTIHLLITITVVYCALKISSKSLFINSFNFIFTLTYLLAGYFATQGNQYGFQWTIPHCVLTLRLIAVSFNLFDGNRCKIKNNNKICEHEEHLVEVPNLLEFYGHCLFPCNFLVGPQYEIHIFQKFLRRNDQVYKLVWKEAIGKLICGVIYLTIYMIGTRKISQNYLITKEFLNSGFFYKMTVIGIIAKVQLMKYIFIWLFTEGGLCLSGIMYDSKKNKKYDIYNVNIVLYETTRSFEGLIKSFNIQTNNWTAKYIYKRLKFMNSKFLSHLSSLMFLAIWHGHKSGYYATFLMEFITVINEKETSSVFNKLQSKYPTFKKIVTNKFIDQIIYFILRVNIFYMLAYSFIPFVLLTNQYYLPVLKSTYYVLFIQAVAIVLINQLIRFTLLSRPKNKSN